MNYVLYLLFFVWPSAVLADVHSLGLGQVAGNLTEPIVILSDFVGTAAMVIGICCLFASFFKYMQYRVNHMAVPLGTVFLLFFTGVILVVLPFVYKLTESGIPFSVNLS